MARKHDNKGTGWRGHSVVWWWAVGALAVVTAIVVTVALVRDNREGGASRAIAHAGTPDELLLGESMQRMPVPGWRVGFDQIGFAEPNAYARFIGSDGNTGFFSLTSGGELGTKVFGVDVTSGRLVGTPVTLPVDVDNCYLNGPPLVLCLSGVVAQGDSQPTVWTADPVAGQLVFSGPTDLNPHKSPQVVGVGTHAVAWVADKGAYGLGRNGELTWLAPGDGIRWKGAERMSADIPPTAVAPQAKGFRQNTMFSVTDGRDLTPAGQLGQSQIYGNGFAFEVNESGNRFSLVFLDESGKELGRYNPGTGGSSMLMSSAELPIARVERGDTPVWEVFTTDGQEIMEIPAWADPVNFRTVGHRLFIQASERSEDTVNWRQFDLVSKTETTTCRGVSLRFSGDLAGYVASDGRVLITQENSHGPDGDVYMATDADTCQTLWSMPALRRHLVKVNRTLVQITDHEVQALVAPR